MGFELKIDDYLLSDADTADYEKLNRGLKIKALTLSEGIRTFVEYLILHIKPEEAIKMGYIVSDDGKNFSIQQ